MRKMGKIILIILAVLIGLVLIIWVGLKIQPDSFSPLETNATSPQTTPIPDGLPAPVERFYRTMYGDSIPVIQSAVITGKASLRLNGITFPGRFRFTYDVDRGYRHYIEATVFGFPLFKVNEWYVDGKGRLELPGQVVENDANTNSAGNQGFYAELMWLAPTLLTDPEVRWEAVDDETAILVIPFEPSVQRFVVRFDPQTGRVSAMETMRSRNPGDATKILWITSSDEWDKVDGFSTFKKCAVTWMDQGTPWAVFTVEQVVLNPDVSTSLLARGE
jgi:hypothetical protein